ncbi:MAG: hypothetical protein HYU52_08035 [Acidobacteria bacterium]|nr:hypothetical protein [Acidobacteriota bacterium]
MAAEIKAQLGHESKLVRGSGGIFDVFADDVRIYSKHETGQFPDESEIIAALRAIAQ